METAVGRVFELENKVEVRVNRKMIDNYLTSLKKGLAQNKSEYLDKNGICENDMNEENTHTRFAEWVNNENLRRFETKG